MAEIDYQKVFILTQKYTCKAFFLKKSFICQLAVMLHPNRYQLTTLHLDIFIINF